MTKPNFEFYVLNYDHNAHKVINFNIFDNTIVYESTLREVKKYCKSPTNYKYINYSIHGYKESYGFNGLCEAIQSALRDEWSRCEYEISVGSIFDDKQEKWDCYSQAAPNIEIIAHECIRAYKECFRGVNTNDSTYYWKRY